MKEGRGRDEVTTVHHEAEETAPQLKALGALAKEAGSQTHMQADTHR